MHVCNCTSAALLLMRDTDDERCTTHATTALLLCPPAFIFPRASLIRSTLQLVPGSLLHEIFRPERQHLLQRVKDQVFLDYDPQQFSLVLKLLRELKITRAGAARPALKSLRPEDEHHLALLLEHLGLSEAFDLAAPDGSQVGMKTPPTDPLAHQPATTNQGLGHHLFSSSSRLASSIVPSSLKSGHRVGADANESSRSVAASRGGSIS